jgi:chaperone BCS1
MPKTITGDAKVCLESLIGALEKAKEDAILKAEEEAKEKEESARLKAEEEAKEKEKEKAKAEEEAKEKDSSAVENAKKQVKENGFCDNGNGELNNKEKKEEGFSH